MATLDPCVVCNAPGTRVRNTRPTSLGRRRRKHCPACDARWSTIEVSASLAPRIRRALVAAEQLEQAMPQLLEVMRTLATIDGEDEETPGCS